ncbi:MAG: iron-sulfur cluster assembly accessory protein [Gammaproteobacteria bacterium]|nr:iron-sulfur cluster assembly accessory protein [Gammaproteobacteria bacterium]
MIKITPAAGEQMQKSFASADENTILRIAVRQKENGEFHYLMGLDDTKADDMRFISQEIKIAVSNEQIDLLDNMEIDFVEISTGKFEFIFKNPNDPKYKQPTE